MLEKKIETLDLYILVRESWYGVYPREDSFCEHLFIGLTKDACRTYAKENGYKDNELEIERWVINLPLNQVAFQEREDF